MIRENVPLKNFRLSIFPLIIVLELALSVLFLVMPFFDSVTEALSLGYELFFGWLLAVLSLLAVVGAILCLLPVFDLTKSPAQDFFHDDKKMRIVGYSTIFVIYLQIVSLAITQIYYYLFISDSSPLYLLIIAFSLILPILLYYIANFEKEPEIVYALSEETPTRIKLSALWLIFLTGVIQLFAVDWPFLVIGLMLLVVTYYFFQLHRLAVSIVPIILIIHFAFSIIITVIAFLSIFSASEILAGIEFDFGFPQQIVIIVMFMILPGIISILLGQSFFRKWLLAWVRSLYPESEMDVTPYDYDEDDEYEEEEE